MDIRKFFTPTSSFAKKPSNEEPKKSVVAAPTKGKSKQAKAAKEPKQTKPAKDKETKRSPARNFKSSKNEEEEVAPKKTEAKKQRSRIIVHDSDTDEEDPLPKKARKQQRSSTVLVSDSDDDSDPPKDPKPTVSKSPTPPARVSPRKKPKTNGSDPPAKKLVPVTAEDFFGSTPKPKLSLSKKLAQAKEVSKAKEAHHDEDFEKTLERLDEREEKACPPLRSSPRKTASVATKQDATETTPKVVSPNKGKKATTRPPMEDKISTRKTPEKEKLKEPEPPRVSSPVVMLERIAEPTKKAPKKEEKPSAVQPAEAKKEVSPAVRRGNSAGYRSYLDREGPRLLGTRDIPEGSPGCLKGVTLVITGVLECIERDDTRALLERCGAKVTQSVSRNTTYLVAGRDSGPAKLRKAEECKVKILDEDGFFELIESRSGGGSSTKKGGGTEPEGALPAEAAPEQGAPSKKRKAEADDEPAEMKIPRVSVSPPEKADVDVAAPSTSKASPSRLPSAQGQMWVDRYRPQTTKQIIGQQGDKSNCHKLRLWLQNWHKSRAGPKRPPPKWGGGGGDGSAFKAALLSGAPGVGKTTTANLVAREAGFSVLELNASDTRSKKSLKQEVAELLGNQTLTGEGLSSKHMLIMDEVDGMAGNQDRGGVQELIALIKSTRIPIVCICNDRSHPKMRSLVNYCFDLRFYRPQIKQIQAAMMSIACKEGLSVTPAVVQEIIMASNQDVRQVLHNLSLWTARTKGISSEQVKADTGKGTKDIRLGPFDVVRKILSSAEGGQSLSLGEKSALFFHDYSMVPMFVQDNYIHVQPLAAQGDKKRHLRLLVEASESICQGDLIERQIRSCGSWSLLPMQAFFSSVIPGELMRGQLREMVSFPAWFGKNSSLGKRQRLLQELYMHMHTRVSANRTQLHMDYLSPLLHSLTQPLIAKGADGVPSTLGLMGHYFLQRADLDTVAELSLWPGMKDPWSRVDSKVKAALTRALNKEGFMTPYATDDMVKKKGKRGSSKTAKGTAEPEEEDNYAEEEDPDPTLVDYD
ncbi:replication factor C subunit 1 isoform X1 [Ixodes scapularis]|uniref:replication factor C subunit 1 isoform X1 n=1 Tax=Ixodes scapularis TaxID=6945 RepID=UPI001A9F24FA|nr:replication factor C subunit 1 isoform X1 [Ixodes scapularis]